MKSIFMKLFIIGLCVSFFPIQAIAEGQTGFHAIEWVNQRQCLPGKGFEVRLATPHANPDGCSNDSVLELSCDARWYLPSVAVFLTAFSNGDTVDAFVNGCDFEGHAIVKAVQALDTAGGPGPVLVDQKTIRSGYAFVVAGQPTVALLTVSAGKTFILTDIVVNKCFNCASQLSRLSILEGATVKLTVHFEWVDPAAKTQSVHYESGVPFAAGSDVVVDATEDPGVDVLITGYEIDE